MPHSNLRSTPRLCGSKLRPVVLAACFGVIAASTVHAAQNVAFGTVKRLPGTAAADSEPPQQAISGANVYIVWHEAASASDPQADVRYARSTNNGRTYGGTANLSASPNVFSSEEQVFANGTNVFVVWTENNGSSKSLYLRRSINGGQTFASRKLITSSGNPSNPRVTAAGANVFVAWQADGVNGNSDIFLRQSMDTAANFGAVRNVSNNAGASEFYFADGGGIRQLGTSGNRVVLSWRDASIAGAGFETFTVEGAF